MSKPTAEDLAAALVLLNADDICLRAGCGAWEASAVHRLAAALAEQRRAVWGEVLRIFEASPAEIESVQRAAGEARRHGHSTAWACGAIALDDILRAAQKGSGSDE